MILVTVFLKITLKKHFFLSRPFSFKKTDFYVFMYYFWLHWVVTAACSLSLVAVSRGYFLVVHGLLISVASLVEHGL